MQGTGELTGFLQERDGSQPLGVGRAKRCSLLCCCDQPVGWSCVLKPQALYVCVGTLFGWAWAMHGQVSGLAAAVLQLQALAQCQQWHVVCGGLWRSSFDKEHVL